jgi:hypothetical protein
MQALAVAKDVWKKWRSKSVDKFCWVPPVPTKTATGSFPLSPAGRLLNLKEGKIEREKCKLTLTTTKNCCGT